MYLLCKLEVIQWLLYLRLHAQLYRHRDSHSAVAVLVHDQRYTKIVKSRGASYCEGDTVNLVYLHKNKYEQFHPKTKSTSLFMARTVFF